MSAFTHIVEKADIMSRFFARQSREPACRLDCGHGVSCPLSNKADMGADSKNLVQMRVSGLHAREFLPPMSANSFKNAKADIV